MIAINHTSYIDFLPAALAAYQRHRRLRFMIKAEMQQVKVVNFLIKHSGDHSGGPQRRGRRLRGRGGAATRRASSSASIRRPPSAAASSSRSSRPARPGWRIEAQVPIVPLIVWGAQRIWTKDHPETSAATKIPITVAVGAPLRAAETVERTDAAMREAMTTLLHGVQQDYHASRRRVLGAAAAGRLARRRWTRPKRSRRRNWPSGHASGPSGMRRVTGDPARTDRDRRRRHAARRRREDHARDP